MIGIEWDIKGSVCMRYEGVTFQKNKRALQQGLNMRYLGPREIE